VSENCELEIEVLVLYAGAHQTPCDGQCVMEAAAYFGARKFPEYANEPFSDRPSFACRTLSAFLRAWNDNVDDDARQTLKPYIMRVIGTNDGKTETRTWILVDWAIREQLPLVLDALKDPKATMCAAGLRGLNPISRDTAKAELERSLPFLNDALARARALARDLALAGEGAVDLALAPGRAVDLALARDLARDLDLAGDLDLARALAGALARARALAGDRAVDLARARALARAGDRALDLDLALALDGQLNDSRHRVMERMLNA